LGIASEGKSGPRRCLASWMAVPNWMVPANARRLPALKGDI
jgi:hypothetical protein